MPFYETVFIARQDVSTQTVETLADQMSTILSDNGGEVKKTEHWGLRNLAYKIRKNRKGHYVLLALDAEPAAVAEMERSMRLNEDILRYLTIRVDELDLGESVMMQNKAMKSSRPRDRGGGDDGDRDGDSAPATDSESKDAAASEETA